MSNELINLIIGGIFGSYITYHVYPVLHSIVEKTKTIISKLKGLK